MRAYKGFNDGRVCRGHKFEVGRPNVTLEANCVRNGFHCAENPLDCFTYYPDVRKSEYWEVEAAGDINEDAVDSKIACTELTLIRRLSIKQMVLAGIAYLARHPEQLQRHVCEKKGEASEAGGFVIVGGTDPAACGALGTVLALIRLQKGTGKIQDIGLYAVDGVNIKPGVYYRIDGTPALKLNKGVS